MEFFTKKSELDRLQSEIKSAPVPEFIEGIILDENHKLSDDAKFGAELAKDKNKWNNYFGI
jgi:hypothetical protein